MQCFHLVFTLPHTLNALVAGGALSSGGEWIRPKKGFLFPVRALSRVFRGKFVTGLAQQARIECWPAGADWARLKPRLYEHDWVVYAKQPLGGPEAALEYLGRYTHRVAISTSASSASTPSRSSSVCVLAPVVARKPRCVYRASNSSTASCCMCCPPASSASATTGYARRRASAPAWRPRGRRSTCRRRHRPLSNRL